MIGSKGWIKIHRRLASHKIWMARPNVLRLWLWCLMNASTKQIALYRNLRVGELVVSRNDLADAIAYEERGKTVKPSKRQLGRILDELVESEMLEVTNQGNKVKILVANYSAWQGEKTKEKEVSRNPNWVEDPNFNCNKMVELWQEKVGPLPHRTPHHTQAMALEMLHKEDHYSSDQIREAIEKIVEHKEALTWVVNAGPTQLRKETKSQRMTMDVVLEWEERKNGTAKRKVYTGLNNEPDALDEIFGREQAVTG